MARIVSLDLEDVRSATSLSADGVRQHEMVPHVSGGTYRATSADARAAGTRSRVHG